MPLKVVVPYTVITVSAVVEALNEYAPQAEARSVRGGRSAYWALLAELWAAGEAFVIVEQDVEIHAKVLPSLTRCLRPWCGFPYTAKGEVTLGCTRFSAALLAAHPDALELAGELYDGTVPKRSWQRLDSHLGQVLRDTYGIEPHRHLPPVTHHHDYDC